jgi:CHAT domain-containing protein
MKEYVLKKRLLIVFSLVFLLGVSAIAFTQDKQPEDAPTKRLRREILRIYKTRGEKGLRQFVKENNEKISHQFIMNFVEFGLKMNLKDEIEKIEKDSTRDSTTSDPMKEMKDQIESLEDSDFTKEIGKQYYNYFKNLDKLVWSSKFIFEEGPKLVKEWLNIAKIMAEEKKDEKLLAHIYSKIAPVNMMLNLFSFCGKDKILSVYNTSGKEGLREFVKDNHEKIADDLIEEFVKSGLEKGKEECLDIARIIAEEKKAEDILKDVYLKYGQKKGFDKIRTDVSQLNKQLKNNETGKLREKILRTYKTKGEKGLREFVKNNNENINHQFIVDFAQTGFNENKKEWLDIAKIIAEEIKNDKTLKAVELIWFQYEDFKEPGTDDISQYELLKEEILNVYNTEGEKGLRQFAKKNNKRINHQFIMDFVKYASREIGWEWLEIAKIVAEEKKDEAALADINFKIAGYSSLFNFQDEENQDNILAYAVQPKDDETRRLKNKIIDVYNTKGETGLRQFVKDKNKKIIHRLTMSFAGWGWLKMKKEWLKIAKILAQETKNHKFPTAMIDSLINALSKQYNTDDNSMADFWGPEKHPKNDETKKLKKEILTVYNTQREIGLRRFARNNTEKITTQFIIDLSQAAYEKGKTEWLIISKIMADEINDERALKAVYLRIEQYSASNNIGYYSPLRNKQPTDDETKKLEKNILSIYYNRGENGLREFVKNNKKINCKFIKDFAQTGLEEEKKEWLDMAKIMAKETKDKKALDVVDFKIKQYNDFRKFQVESAIISKNQGDTLMMPPSNYYLLILDSLLDSYQDSYLDRLDIAKFSENLSQLLKYHSETSRNIIDSIRQTYGGDEQKTKDARIEINNLMEKMSEPLPVPELYKYIADRVERRMISSEKTQTFMGKFFKYFEETVLKNLENKDYHEGFQNAELIKARKFRQQLAEARQRFEKGINPALMQKLKYLLSTLSDLQLEIYQAEEAKNKKNLRELKKKYDRVYNDYEKFMIKMRGKVPMYASNTYQDTISVQLLQQVLKTEELVLQYFLSPGNVFVFVISKEDFQVIKLEANENDINRTVNRYLLSLKVNDFKRSLSYGNELYQMIFKPLNKELKGKTSILVVPDGTLALVPFESLVTDDGTLDNPVYLLGKYPVKYIQSSAVLEMIRNPLSRKDKNKTKETTKTNRFIGFGDPVYDYKSFKEGKVKDRMPAPDNEKVDTLRTLNLKGYNNKDGILNRLEVSGEEVEAIAQLFEKKSQHPPVVYVRENASEENAKLEDLKEFGYIHFSCHGVLGDEFQGLVLSQIPESKEDGYLTLFDIMTCAYNAKLVVLSACQTGKEAKGDGVTGLTRAVMYAGAPAVVASLWNVQDIATKELMVKFYENMLEKGMKKEEALRQAKLEMIKDGTYASPYYWSAFVMYGE